MQKRVIALVGMTGAGKSMVADYLTGRGLPLITFGAIILAEVRNRGLEINPDNERMVRHDLREIHGMDACAKLALPEISQQLEQHPLVVIDGLYSYSEYLTLRQTLAEALLVVHIFAPRSLRYARLAERGFRPLSEAQAAQRDHDEITKIEKGGPIAIADAIIVNDATEEATQGQVANLLEPLLSKPS